MADTYTISRILLPSGDVCEIKDTTYAAATADAAGLMSAADKERLDGLVTATAAEVKRYLGIS